MNDLWSFLNSDIESTVNKNNEILVKNGFVVPGYWVALSAYCRLNSIRSDNVNFSDEKTESYSLAIALEQALDGTDSYPFERKNSGRNYSELVHLNNEDDTDRATEAINSCIRNLFNESELSLFVRDLCEVVGDLHDNVWSHGMNTGFSMAQKWKKPRSVKSEYCLEFALADCGLGFLRELQRVGLGIKNDEEAISWCIEEGNSSKKIKQTDEWEQQLPVDISGNPMPGVAQVKVSENHHMGLGLAKLITLVKNYKGNLWLTSGEKTLTIKSNGEKKYKNNKQNWQGVALACRFDTGKARAYSGDTDDEAITSLINLLGGNND